MKLQTALAILKKNGAKVSLNEAAKQDEPHFKVGDVLVSRTIHTGGEQSYSLYHVNEVEMNSKKGEIYHVSKMNPETEIRLKPSSDIQYGFGHGFSRQTVVKQKVIIGAGEPQENEYIWRVTWIINGGREMRYTEYSRATGRFKLPHNNPILRMRPYKEGEELVVAEYEITDKDEVIRLFDEHPEWKREKPEIYDMNR